MSAPSSFAREASLATTRVMRAGSEEREWRRVSYAPPPPREGSGAQLTDTSVSSRRCRQTTLRTSSETHFASNAGGLEGEPPSLEGPPSPTGEAWAAVGCAPCAPEVGPASAPAPTGRSSPPRGAPAAISAVALESWGVGDSVGGLGGSSVDEGTSSADADSRPPSGFTQREQYLEAHRAL